MTNSQGRFFEVPRSSFKRPGEIGCPISPALLFICFLVFVTPFLESLERVPLDDYSALPRIQRLDNRDKDFVRYLSEVESNRRRLFNARGQNQNYLAEGLTIYVYTPGPQEDILNLAARCNIPYSSIATINRLQNPADLNSANVLFLPSVPGLFIPENPRTELERLLSVSTGTNSDGVPMVIDNGNEKIMFYFLPGADFNPTERIFFLNRGFSFPLKNFRITSSFGPRQNPITGNQRFHQGLDLAAPAGTEVYTTRDGTVSEQGEDPILGRYIIISHRDNWVSLYGHLSRIETTLRQQVNSGSLIGRVGSTGQSTGPHLHFELRQNGKAQDPEKLLRLFQGNTGTRNP
jgi:murein DD-endopeptidase MepM/ murein hydrolase activator NlpD